MSREKNITECEKEIESLKNNCKKLFDSELGREELGLLVHAAIVFKREKFIHNHLHDENEATLLNYAEVLGPIEGLDDSKVESTKVVAGSNEGSSLLAKFIPTKGKNSKNNKKNKNKKR